MIFLPKSPQAAISRPTPEDFFPKHRPPTHRTTDSAPFSPATPISPPSDPARRLLQGPPAKSKLLAAAKSKLLAADNGSEFHNYKKVEKALGADVYFALPHHAWERGTNENTNGLIRQYLPKGSDLGWVTQRDCTRIAETLNNRPRKRLGFRTPNEVYYDPSNFALQT